MYLLGLGLIFMVMKYMEFGPVAQWDWWIVLSPLGAAVVWWAWADWSGYTKRKAVEKEEKFRKNRIDKQREKLGIGAKRR
jgi:small Trp-rich protein